VTSVTLPDGRILIASSGDEGVLHLWDLLGAEPLLEPLTPFEGGVRSLAAVPLPSGRQLLSLGYQDGTVRLWDPDAAAPVGQPLTGHQGPVRSLAAVPMPTGASWSHPAARTGP
jgi:WD40 repeat protein